MVWSCRWHAIAGLAVQHSWKMTNSPSMAVAMLWWRVACSRSCVDLRMHCHDDSGGSWPTASSLRQLRPLTSQAQPWRERGYSRGRTWAGKARCCAKQPMWWFSHRYGHKSVCGVMRVGCCVRDYVCISEARMHASRCSPACVQIKMGSYVPASDCTLGVVDQVFSRVGAADDLAGNRSTFMCEMQETASILNKVCES